MNVIVHDIYNMISLKIVPNDSDSQQKINISE